MNMQVVKLEEYGLNETRAKEVKQSFDVVLSTAEELEKQYNDVLKSAEVITPEVCEQARQLRLKYVKVRTGISKVHKEQKAFYLSGGRAVDGIKNAYTHAVIGNEEKLKEIETHFDRIAEERLQKIRQERIDLISPYIDDAEERSLEKMRGDEFEALLVAKKKAFEDRVEAERKAEFERLEAEKKERVEREKIRKENERLKAEADALRKVEEQRKAKAEAEQARKDAETKRAADVEHRRTVNRAIVNALIEKVGITEGDAREIVTLAVKGEIAGLIVQY